MKVLLKAAKRFSALFIFFLWGCFSFAEPTIKIGVSSSLTGNAASYGVDIKNVLNFANKKLGEGKFELIFEDDRCQAKDAVTIAQQFINVLQLKYVTGFACSSVALSSGKLYQNSKILTMVTMASAAEVTKIGDYVFRTWPSDALSAKKLREYVALHHRKIGVLNEQTDYAQSFYRDFSENVSSLTIVKEDFLTDATDLRSVLLKLKNSGLDALVLNTQTEITLFNALKQLRELKIDLPIYSSYLAGSSAFLDKAGNAADGIIYVDLPTPEDTANENGKALYQEFIKEYGPLNSFGNTFLSVFEGFRALSMALHSNEDPRNFLLHTTFHGIFGDWKFSPDREISGLYPVIKMVKAGKGVVL